MTTSKTCDSFFMGSTVTPAPLLQQGQHVKMTDKFFSDERFKAGLVKLLGELVYSNLNRGA